MLYVAGFNEKRSPQVYISANTFKEAFEKVERWVISHRNHTLVCINEFTTDNPIEISPNSYTIDSQTKKSIPKDYLSIYGIRYVDDDSLEEKEKVIIASEMGSIAYSASGTIKGLWRITGENDIVLI